MRPLDRSLSLKVVLRCRDFAASRRFYAEVLGLAVVEEWDAPEGKGCVFGFGPTGRSGFFEIYEMTPQDRRHQDAFREPLASDKIDVQLGTASVDAWVSRLSGRWPLEGPETLPWGQRWIKLRDPDDRAGLKSTLQISPRLGALTIEESLGLHSEQSLDVGFLGVRSQKVVRVLQPRASGSLSFLGDGLVHEPVQTDALSLGEPPSRLVHGSRQPDGQCMGCGHRNPGGDDTTRWCQRRS